MCGIYGMAKSPQPLNNKQLKKCRSILRSLAISSETRGTHSSGLAVVGDEQVIHKSLLPSSKFVSTNEWSESMKMMPGNNIYLGHTRLATEGAITRENAHPFRVGNTIGAHNGCLYNMDELKVLLEKSCQVDSQLIFKSIEDSPNIQEAVEYLDGDFALSFVKDNMYVLNLCREENRPLYACYISSLKTLFYASEESFLEKALISQNLKSEIWSLATNRLYSFDIFKFDEHSTNCEKIDFDYDSTKYVWTSITSNRYNQYFGDGSSTSTDTISGDVIRDVEDAGISREDIFPIEDRYISRRWVRDNTTAEWYWLTDDNELILSSSLSDEHWRQVNEYYELEFLEEDYWLDEDGNHIHCDSEGVLHPRLHLDGGVVSSSKGEEISQMDILQNKMNNEEDS